MLPAFECIAAQLDSAPATSRKRSEVLAFDLKSPFILPAKTPESRGESKWTFVFVKSLATSMTLWDTWHQIDTRRKKPGLQEQTEPWQWLSYYSHLSMKPLSRARSPWWSMSLPFENASPQDQIVSRISDNTTKTSARALRTHHANTYIYVPGSGSPPHPPCHGHGHNINPPPPCGMGGSWEGVGVIQPTAMQLVG